jgi:ribosome maturation factor RimP
LRDQLRRFALSVPCNSLNGTDDKPASDIAGSVSAGMTWQAVVEHTVVTLGYELVETERTPGGLLRVYIDRVAGDPRGEFIVVEDCEAVTRQLQHTLEVEDCSYERLEVSSPGLDRPLKKAADFARFAGQKVNLTLRMPFKGRKRYSGTLLALPGGDEGASGWRLLLDEPAPDAAGAPGKVKTDTTTEVDRALDFQLDEVREARLVPVLDFKGRRFLPAAPDGTGTPAAVDGGLGR